MYPSYLPSSRKTVIIIRFEVADIDFNMAWTEVYKIGPDSVNIKRLIIILDFNYYFD